MEYAVDSIEQNWVYLTTKERLDWLLQTATKACTMADYLEDERELFDDRELEVIGAFRYVLEEYGAELQDMVDTFDD